MTCLKILILSNRAFVTRKGAKRVEAELCVKMHPLGAAEENGLIPLREAFYNIHFPQSLRLVQSSE